MQNNSNITTKSSSTPSIHFKSLGDSNYFSWLEPRLLKTIIDLCTSRTPFDSLNEYLPQLDVLLIRNTILEQRRLAASLWSVYSELIGAAPKETKIDLDNFMSALTASLSGEFELNLIQNSLNSVVELAKSVGFSFALISPSLNLLILNNPNISKILCWKTLRKLNEVLTDGASLLNEHFEVFVDKFFEYFEENGEEKISNSEEAWELAELIASLIRTFAPILQISILLKLQHKVCLTVLSPSPWIGAIKLLNALLENNHEGIPVPIQIASNIFFREYTSENTEFKEQIIKGRALCQIYKRPKRLLLGQSKEEEVMVNESVVV
uniref:Uncharacterized protein n=1 Tax=Meloidogyne floridensis TaxID=298350 RepID=A0A915P587_9BILA